MTFPDTAELQRIPEFAIYTQAAIKRAFAIVDMACDRMNRQLNLLQTQALAFYVLDKDNPLDLPERLIMAAFDILPPNPLRPQTNKERETEVKWKSLATHAREA